MPKNSSEYDRQYRLKNKDKLRAYERERYKRRTGNPKPEVIQVPGVDMAFKDSDKTSVYETAAKKCYFPFCKEQGTFKNINGINVYLCEEHAKIKPK